MNDEFLKTKRWIFIRLFEIRFHFWFSKQLSTSMSSISVYFCLVSCRPCWNWPWNHLDLAVARKAHAQTGSTWTRKNYKKKNRRRNLNSVPHGPSNKCATMKAQNWPKFTVAKPWFNGFRVSRILALKFRQQMGAEKKEMCFLS